MVGNEIIVCGIVATVLEIHEYRPHNYVAAVKDAHGMIRVAYFTTNDSDDLLVDAEVLPEFFLNQHKALAYGLRYA